MHRVFWYIVHVAMEDIEVLKRGLVLLIYPQEARLDQFDHSLWKSIAESCKYSLPIQWKSTHIVHPNRFFSIIHPLFMSTLPKTVQDRVVVHSGTKMKVLANLLRYCLPWDRIPSDVGGCVDLDFGKWLSERMIKEDKMSSVSQGATTSQGGVGNLLAQLTGQSQLAQATQLMQTAPLGLGSSIPTLPLPDQAMSAAAHPLFGGNKNQLLLNLTHPTGNITNVPLVQQDDDRKPSALPIDLRFSTGAHLRCLLSLAEASPQRKKTKHQMHPPKGKPPMSNPVVNPTLAWIAQWKLNWQTLPCPFSMHCEPVVLKSPHQAVLLHRNTSLLMETMSRSHRGKINC
eukprot:CCRYP_016313-RB/>CCRYP_016313-RB protein AED:0.05 eAED:0.05 QI:791/1/1/1/1/1/2/195/342